jgi:hypothetical protein
MEERKGAQRDLVGKHEGTNALGRPMRRLKDNIKMGLQKTGKGNMDWIDMVRGRNRWRDLVNLGVP